MEYCINCSTQQAAHRMAEKQLVRIQVFLNIRYFSASIVLILNRRSKMTPKYDTHVLIIRRHYKWEDREIDKTRHNYSTMTWLPHLHVPIILVSIPYLATPYTILATSGTLTVTRETPGSHQ